MPFGLPGSADGRRVAAIAMVGLLGGLIPDVAVARDTDGTRLGAQAQEVGSTQSDELDPPEDSSDWRYVQLEETDAIEFRIEVDSSDSPVTLRLTQATGDEMRSVETKGGTASIRRELEPGIYYVEVTCESAVAYRITVE